MSENFKTCRYCGKEVLSDASFCIYCMNELNEKTEINAPKVLTNRRARLIIVCILTVFSSIFLFAQNINNTMNREKTAEQNTVLKPTFDLKRMSDSDLASMNRAHMIKSGDSIDIDGDGDKEVIEFEIDEMQSIKIDGNPFYTNIEDIDLPADLEVYTGDIYVSDKCAEIFIVQTVEDENELNKWLYVYRFDGSKLTQMKFNGNLLIRDNSGRVAYVPVVNRKRAHMPSEPIYLTGEGAIGWQDYYTNSQRDVYRFFELYDDTFEETERLLPKVAE